MGDELGVAVVLRSQGVVEFSGLLEFAPKGEG